MACNCNQQTNYNICNPTPCQEPQDCSCPTILKSDCVTYSGDDLECSGIVTGQTLTETIEQLDTFICEKVDDITNALTLKNIGDGAKVYKGDDLLGRKELRTLTSTGNSVTITQGTDTINLEVDVEPTTICLTSEDKTVTIAEVEGCFDLSINLPTSVNVGTGEDVYKTFNLFTNQNEFKTLKSNNSTIVLSPSTDELSLEVNNLQKTINTFPYTLSDIDDKFTIFIDNGASNAVINVPDGLVANFCCTLIQKGTGEVAVITTGTSSLSYPSTLQNIIKGQNYWALIEKELNLNNYFLIGSLKTV